MVGPGAYETALNRVQKTKTERRGEGERERRSQLGSGPSAAHSLTQAAGQVPLAATPHYYHLLLWNSSSSTSLSVTEPSTTVSSLSVSLWPPLPRHSMVRPPRSPGTSSGSGAHPSAAAAILRPGRAAPRRRRARRARHSPGVAANTVLCVIGWGSLLRVCALLTLASQKSESVICQETEWEGGCETVSYL